METKVESPIGAGFGLGDKVSVRGSDLVGVVIGWDIVYVDGGIFEYRVQFDGYAEEYDEDELVLAGE